jgi:hypothetical protein
MGGQMRALTRGTSELLPAGLLPVQRCVNMVAHEWLPDEAGG